VATQAINLSWKQLNNSWREKTEAAQLGIDIKNWLVSEGLILYTDFEWRLNTTDRTIEFKFFNKEHYASMIALKYQG